MRPLTMITTALTTLTGFLWYAAFARLWPSRPVPSLAATGTVIAFLCWQRAASRKREDRERLYERREDVHLETIEMFTRPRARSRPTGPLRRVP